MKTRNQLYQIFLKEHQDLMPLSVINLIFKSFNDQELAKEFGLKILRKGYFY